MQWEHSKQIVVVGTLEQVFEAARIFLPYIGFRPVESKEQNLVLAERGSKTGFYLSSNVKDLPTKLYITLSPRGSEVEVSYRYEITLVGIMLGGDRKSLDAEVEQLGKCMVMRITGNQ